MDPLRARLLGPGEGLIKIPMRSRLKVAVVSTLPPRQCGIATFAASLCAAIRKTDASIALEFVAIEHLSVKDDACNDARWRISQGDRASFLEVADSLNRSDVQVVCVEHEFRPLRDLG